MYKNFFSNRQNYCAPKICLRRDEFLTTTKSKRIHDFLKHYSDVKNKIFENKPINIRLVTLKRTKFPLVNVVNVVNFSRR